MYLYYRAVVSEPCLSTDCPQKGDRIRKRSTNPDIEQPGENDVTQNPIRQTDAVDNSAVKNPSDSPDPEVAVHGVAHAHAHDHESRDVGNSQQIGDVFPDQEIALHDGEDVHSSQVNSDDQRGATSGLQTDVDPDDMLHDSGSQHAHIHSDDAGSSGPLPSPDTPNPDWQVTGHEHHTRLGVARDEEKDDFIAWKAEAGAKSRSEPPPDEKSWLWRGFSLPFVSDSTEDDETVVKRRYMTRGEDTSGDGEGKQLKKED